jgi:Ser/Thr protein kinase RdoA (MazF antagonist)
MSETPQIPESILASFGLNEAHITPITVGLINRTYLIEQPNQKSILQQVNPIFGPAVHHDIEAITAHLARQGMHTTRLIRNQEQSLYTIDTEGGVWRQLSFLEGRTIQKVNTPQITRAAGALVAKFHRAVSTLEHQFHFSRPGAHDTPLHLLRLQLAVQQHTNHPNYERAASMADEILSLAARLTPLSTEPQRIIHGDLKISNLLFSEDLTEALALLDLDTMARSTIPIELGDALRSWCNPGGENVGAVTFEAEFFRAALQGYAREASGFLTQDERGALVLGALTISLELSARFCADALNEAYFGWDKTRFASRSEHNLVRAQSQLLLARSIDDQRGVLEALVTQSFR